MNRRNFTKLSIAGMATTNLGADALGASKSKRIKNQFVHHVFFWLKNPDSEEDRAALVKGLMKMVPIKTVLTYHLGIPADTMREAIERSYSISWFTTHKDRKAQDDYQVDPIHKKFVEECNHLWSKVVVYDSVELN
jgi:hypothetical protein